jgi:hypothetical protein
MMGCRFGSAAISRGDVLWVTGPNGHASHRIIG